MNEEIKQLFETFQNVVDEQNRKIEELTGKLDTILGGAEDAYNDWDYKNRFNDFSERNKDVDFDSYNDKLKNDYLEGPDFDLKKRIFDDYEASDKSMSESDYVAGVIAHVAEQLEALKKSFEDTTGEDVDKVEAKTEDEPGEEPKTEVEAKNEEGETVAAAEAEKAPEEEPKEEEPKEEEKPAEEEKPEEPEKEESDTELDDFIKGLEDDKAKMDAKHVGN